MAIEYIVETAQLAPRACVGCGGNIGPFVDIAEVEIPTAAGPIPYHIYLCKRVCARSVARLCGFSPGKRMNELANAAERLEEIKKELAHRDDTIAQQAEKLRLSGKEIQVLVEQRDQLSGRVSQLQERIAAEAKANLNLVGDAA